MLFGASATTGATGKRDAGIASSMLPVDFPSALGSSTSVLALASRVAR
jgi:hypothetical protein